MPSRPWRFSCKLLSEKVRQPCPTRKGTGKTAVIALGGNALGNTPQEQLELVQNTAKHIVDMIQDGTNVVVSHGNGPQVGMINNAFAYAAANDDKTPDMPFPEAGAMSQGYIGYQLSQAILNDLKSRDIMRSTACIVTQTVVDEDDPAFQNPTKPVGAFMDEETAKAKAEAMGITVKEDAGRGWRQVVASPIPKRIVEFDAVRDLVEDGYVVVSTGGGGVPVFETENGYVGTPAVIDKDRSSALHGRRARRRHADHPHRRGEGVHRLQRAASRRQIDSEMTVSQAREVHRRRASSPPARMLPKVRGLHRVRARRTPRARRSSRRSSARPRDFKRRDGHRHRRRLSCSK